MIQQLCFSFVLVFVGLVAVSAHATEDLDITIDYPGGNLLVSHVNNDTVHIRQDIRDTTTWWFYWNFMVSAEPGRTLTFKFQDRSPIGVYGPAYSLDEGRTWAWLGSSAVKGSSFQYTFPETGGPVQFAFSIPYQEDNLNRFLKSLPKSPYFEQDVLCNSKKGRAVEQLRVGCLDKEPKYRVLLTARHHACESIASFVLEGILAEALADSNTGEWLREHVEILAIPFMDKDGVEDGDQGKNRHPRDHNRDYVDTSIHPEVDVLRKLVPEWSQDKLVITLDLHSPSLRGKHNEDIYLVGSANPKIAEQQLVFSTYLEGLNKGPLPYKVSNNLLFGQAWNTNKNYTQGKSFGRWGGEQPGVQLSGTFEIPYANASGVVITPENAREFGQSIAHALKAYLENE